MRGIRRALDYVGGPVEARAADAALERCLRRALDVPAEEARVQAHVHGFHSYPARLHPDTAHALIEELSAPGDVVLDPFCGSGTVLVEARLLGRRALGSDLNPLAVALAELKTGGATPELAEALRRGAAAVAEHALGRKAGKLGPTEPYGPEDRALFAPHVLLELDGLRHGIERLPDRAVRRALSLVHSALLTKVSQRAGDSSSREQVKRIAAGFTIRFFVAKAEELARRLLEFTALVPANTPRARVRVADARRLDFVRDASVRLVVSSPPYPGVYDYYEHHRVRLRWLRLDARDFARDELGARRTARVAGARDAERAWQRDFTRVLGELRRVLARNGSAALIVADSVLAGRPQYVERWLPPLVQSAGLTVVGRAAQERPYFHAPTGQAFSAEPRREHLFVLRRP